MDSMSASGARFVNGFDTKEVSDAERLGHRLESEAMPRSSEIQVKKDNALLRR
jgi:hypothetical protein